MSILSESSENAALLDVSKKPGRFTEFIKTSPLLIDYENKVIGVISVLLSIYFVFHTIPNFMILVDYQNVKKKSCKNEFKDVKFKDNKEKEDKINSCKSRSDAQKAQLAINIINIILGTVLLILCILSLIKLWKFGVKTSAKLPDTDDVTRIWFGGKFAIIIGLYVIGISVPQLLVISDNDDYNINVCEKKKEKELNNCGSDAECRDDVEFNYKFKCQITNLREDESKAYLAIIIIQLIFGISILIGGITGNKAFVVGATETRYQLGIVTPAPPAAIPAAIN